MRNDFFSVKQITRPERVFLYSQFPDKIGITESKSTKYRFSGRERIVLKRPEVRYGG